MGETDFSSCPGEDGVPCISHVRSLVYEKGEVP